MQAVTTIGLDIAKSVFQIHGVDAAGNIVVRRKLKRRYVLPFFQGLPPCLIGIEACASSHHWSRDRQQDRKNGVGHDGQGGSLQGTRRTGGVNEIAPGIRRDVKVGRANST